MTTLSEEFVAIVNRLDEILTEVEDRVEGERESPYGSACRDGVMRERMNDLVSELSAARNYADVARDRWIEINENGGGI